MSAPRLSTNHSSSCFASSTLLFKSVRSSVRLAGTSATILTILISEFHGTLLAYTWTKLSKPTKKNYHGPHFVTLSVRPCMVVVSLTIMTDVCWWPTWLNSWVISSLTPIRSSSSHNLTSTTSFHTRPTTRNLLSKKSIRFLSSPTQVCSVSTQMLKFSTSPIQLKSFGPMCLACKPLMAVVKVVSIVKTSSLKSPKKFKTNFPKNSTFSTSRRSLRCHHQPKLCCCKNSRDLMNFWYWWDHHSKTWSVHWSVRSVCRRLSMTWLIASSMVRYHPTGWRKHHNRLRILSIGSSTS